MAHKLCELILALIACAVGLSIVVVEWLIIAEEAKGTPGFFILLHRMVATKGKISEAYFSYIILPAVKNLVTASIGCYLFVTWVGVGDALRKP